MRWNICLKSQDACKHSVYIHNWPVYFAFIGAISNVCIIIIDPSNHADQLTLYTYSIGHINLLNAIKQQNVIYYQIVIIKSILILNVTPFGTDKHWNTFGHRRNNCFPHLLNFWITKPYINDGLDKLRFLRTIMVSKPLLDNTPKVLNGIKVRWIPWLRKSVYSALSHALLHF